MIRKYFVIIFVLILNLSFLYTYNYQQCQQLLVFAGSASNYCDAWTQCYSMNGRLILENDFSILISCGIMTSGNSYFTGLSDLVYERYTSKTERKFFDGSELQNINWWMSVEPNNYGDYENCAKKVNGQLNDISCMSTLPFICVSNGGRKYLSNKMFTNNSTEPIFNLGGAANCCDSMTTRNALQCGTQ